MSDSEHPAPEKKTAEERHAERINALPWQPWRPGDLTVPVFTTPDEPLLAEGEEEQNDGQPKLQVDQNELLNLQRRAEQQGFQQGQEAGQKQGYAAGFQQGLEAGQQQGLQEGQHQQAVLTEHWQNMVTDFQQTLDALDSVIASRLMQMALTAAKQIIGQAPICDGSALLNQIQQLIQQEPMFKGKPQL
ncbi:flagellar assembly protein H, partial [Ewingella americana]